MMNPNQAQFGGSFQQPPAQQPKGCLGRNWKWMVPVGCLGLILGVVALVVGILFFVMSAMKSSDVYQGALEMARAHSAATGRLGEPIKDGWLVKGSVNIDAGGGTANLEIPLSGPKKSGTLFVRAVSPDGVWLYERLDLAVEGAETVSLLDRNAVRPPPGAPVDVEEDADDAAAEETETIGEGEPAGSSSTSDAGAVSVGALDGKAISKPQPPYPALAKAARASGLVTVRVTVDETGHVVSAEPATGHPLLRAASAEAAKQARFAPTLRDGKPVRVTGVLTYNFLLEQ